MPRFSENEKAIILKKLYIEGERLFIALGLKKVTVDDLVKAAGIAKGSFYAFFTSKEHLYMDIASKLQEKMWREMDDFLMTIKHLPPIELTKSCFLWMFEQLEHYPMLKTADSETADYLYRKLPREIIESHTRDDSRELKKLQEYGVSFKCSIELATKTLQTIAVCLLSLQNHDQSDKSAIIDIILDGILKEIVNEKIERNGHINDYSRERFS